MMVLVKAGMGRDGSGNGSGGGSVFLPSFDSGK